jgi:hypothetical protein
MDGDHHTPPEEPGEPEDEELPAEWKELAERYSLDARELAKSLWQPVIVVDPKLDAQLWQRARLGPVIKAAEALAAAVRNVDLSHDELRLFAKAEPAFAALLSAESEALRIAADVHTAQTWLSPCRPRPGRPRENASTHALIDHLAWVWERSGGRDPPRITPRKGRTGRAPNDGARFLLEALTLLDHQVTPEELRVALDGLFKPNSGNSP